MESSFIGRTSKERFPLSAFSERSFIIRTVNYLLYGAQYPMIKRRLDKILKERLTIIDELSVVSLSYEKTALEDLLIELQSCPLGYERKAVIIDHAVFLSSVSDQKTLTALEPYVQSDRPDLDLFFIVRETKINERLNIVKKIRETGQILAFLDLKKEDWPVYVRRYFKKQGYEIEERAVKELIARIKGDLNVFLSEAEKLMLYELETKKITLIDVTLLVGKPLEDNVFQIMNALIRGENALALSIYRDLKNFGTKTTDGVPALLGGQFRFLHSVLHLKRSGLSKIEIATEIKASEIRVRIALMNAGGLSIKALQKALLDLAELDLSIKSGRIGRDDGLEFFLLRFRPR